MYKPLFNDGRVDSLEDLYSAISDSSINNIKEAMRCVIKSTGIVISGSAFAAYINGDHMIVPIGDIVFGNYEIFSPLKPTTVSVDIPSADSGETVVLIATLKYETVLPYPSFPSNESEITSTTADTLSVPTIEISIEGSWGASDDSVKIGQITYTNGIISYSDERRSNSMSLLDPPEISFNAPVIIMDQPYIYQLPDVSGVSIDTGYDTKHKATFARFKWSVPRGMVDFQYFTVDLVPVADGVEFPDRKVSSSYFPTLSEIETLGPSPDVFVNIRCIPGLRYKAYLYGYYSRLSLTKRELAVLVFDVASDNIVPDSSIEASVTDLVPSGASIQIDSNYRGPDKIQVFISNSTGVIAPANLFYEGPSVPVVYTDSDSTYILIRVIDALGKVTHSSNEILHLIIDTSSYSEVEEQLTFIVPSGSDPTHAPGANFTVAEFEAPYNFKISKALYSLTRNKETASPGGLTGSTIEVLVNTVSRYSWTYAAHGSDDTLLGESAFASNPIIEIGDDVEIIVACGTSVVYPYYGVVTLYILKEIT